MRLNLIGRIFGRWTVIEKKKANKWRNSSWLCRCECGNVNIIQTSTLTRGGSKSCGCLQKELATERAKIKSGEAAFNQLYNNYRHGALHRKMLFEITKEEFRKLTSENCYYCGIEPSQIAKPSNDNGNYIYNGIDRVNSLKGYVLENCVPCCYKCNKAKQTETKDDFMIWLNKAYKHSIKNTEYDV